MTDWAGESIDRSSIETLLRRRGHILTATGDVRQVLLPEEYLSEVEQPFALRYGVERYREVFGPGARERYHDLFGRASFRKVVRKLLDSHGAPVPMDELVKQAGDKASDYVTFLEALHVAEHQEGGVAVTRQIDNFGTSFEHHVAYLCRTELRGDAEWGVKLKDLPRAGGDYDVLAWLPPILVYIECKTGDPWHIEEVPLRQFLQRVVELAPDIAVLLVDTETDLTVDSDERLGLISRINEIIWRALGADERADRQPIKPQRTYPGISWGYRRTYVTNSHKTILGQLDRCLQHYYAIVRNLSFYSGLDQVDFLSGSSSSGPVADGEGAGEGPR